MTLTRVVGNEVLAGTLAWGVTCRARVDSRWQLPLGGEGKPWEAPEDVRSIEEPTREERRGRREEEEIEELDIEPGSCGGQSVVSWGERHSRTQSQARATADDGRTEARSGLSSSDRGAGDTVSDSGELPAQAHDRRSAAGCGRATGCSNTLESAGWRVELSGSGWGLGGSGAQGAQGAERGGWDLRTGQGVGSSRAVQHARPASTEARIVIGHARPPQQCFVSSSTPHPC